MSFGFVGCRALQPSFDFDLYPTLSYHNVEALRLTWALRFICMLTSYPDLFTRLYLTSYQNRPFAKKA